MADCLPDGWGEQGSIDVHGSVTWDAERHDGKYWLGFDCAHYVDLPSPGFIKRNPNSYRCRFLNELIKVGCTFKDVNFCTEECEKIGKTNRFFLESNLN